MGEAQLGEEQRLGVLPDYVLRKLDRRIHERRWSQQKLANEAGGYSRGQINRWLGQARGIGLDDIQRIARALGFTLSELFAETDEAAVEPTIPGVVAALEAAKLALLQIEQRQQPQPSAASLTDALRQALALAEATENPIVAARQRLLIDDTRGRAAKRKRALEQAVEAPQQSPAS